MSGERAKLRGVVLSEDKRTERFLRKLLRALGYTGRFRFETAPSGRGAAEAWVLARYPDEVSELRRKRYQRSLCIIAVRDGDAIGVEARKRQLDDALREANLEPRSATERIAAPVPTWAIENWLLDLLEVPSVDEEQRETESGKLWKHVFEQLFGEQERSALTSAATNWSSASVRLPSLEDGRVELRRIDQ